MWSPEEITALVGAEVERRYGDRARVRYVDTQDGEARASRTETLSEIEDRGLVFPVTVVDGVPLNDGAVSFPAILRAVETRVGADGDA